MHWVRHIEVRRLSLHSRNSHVAWATKLDMTDLIDSNIDLFMYLIEGNKSGTWKARRLNWT